MCLRGQERFPGEVMLELRCGGRGAGDEAKKEGVKSRGFMPILN